MFENSDLLGIGIAAIGGAAIGIDRQRSYKENEPGAIGGLRTFTLLGTLSGVCGFLITKNFVAAAVVILSSAALMVLLVRLNAGRIARDATTEVAALVVLVSGVVAGLGHLGIAAALYAWTLLLLIEKSWLHTFVDRVGIIELQATAQFAAMALIVLPLLPSRNFGPQGILNLRSIWILVLIFSGISFLGYLARRALGNQIGWVLTGFIGGLVSSTQVTLSFARDSRRYPESHIPLFGGAMAATAVSMLRVCILCIFLRPALAMATLAYVATPVLIGALTSVYSMRRQPKETGSFEEKSPLRIVTALYLSLIFITSQCLVLVARLRFGTAGILGSAGLLGSIDVDALLASLLPMVRQGMETNEAARVLVLGVACNTLVKLAVALIWGAAQFRKYASFGLLGVFVVLAGSLILFR